MYSASNTINKIYGYLWSADPATQRPTPPMGKLDSHDDLTDNDGGAGTSTSGISSPGLRNRTATGRGRSDSSSANDQTDQTSARMDRNGRTDTNGRTDHSTGTDTNARTDLPSTGTDTYNRTDLTMSFAERISDDLTNMFADRKVQNLRSDINLMRIHLEALTARLDAHDEGCRRRDGRLEMLEMELRNDGATDREADREDPEDLIKDQLEKTLHDIVEMEVHGRLEECVKSIKETTIKVLSKFEDRINLIERRFDNRIHQLELQTAQLIEEATETKTALASTRVELVATKAELASTRTELAKNKAELVNVSHDNILQPISQPISRTNSMPALDDPIGSLF